MSKPLYLSCKYESPSMTLAVDVAAKQLNFNFKEDGI